MKTHFSVFGETHTAKTSTLTLQMARKLSSEFFAAVLFNILFF